MEELDTWALRESEILKVILWDKGRIGHMASRELVKMRYNVQENTLEHRI